MRRNPRPTFGFALVVMGAITVFSIVVVVLVTAFAFSRTVTAAEEDADTLAAGSVAIVLLSALIPGVLALAATGLLQGVISLEVARATVGEKLSLGALWRAARGRIGALIGWTLLLTGAVILGIAVVALLIGLLVALGGTGGVVIGVLLGILTALGSAVLFAWLGTKWAFVPSVLMLERLPLRAAIARSWSLTGGVFWKTFGIILLVSVIVQTVSSVVTFPVNILASFGTLLLDPSGSEEGFIVMTIVVSLLTVALTVVLTAVAAVAQSATPALLYIDTRMRKEGLDIELTRFVEARQSGDASVPDPYLQRPGSTMPAAADSSPWA